MDEPYTTNETLTLDTSYLPQAARQLDLIHVGVSGCGCT